jgi:hypothetical protein
VRKNNLEKVVFMPSREQNRYWWVSKSLEERQALGSARRKLLRRKRQKVEARRNVILARVLDSPVSLHQLADLCGATTRTISHDILILRAESDIFARKWEEHKQALRSRGAKNKISA